MDLPVAISQKGGGIEMKRGWKIFWIACIIAAGTGLALCVMALGMGVTSEAIAARLPDGVGLGVISGDSYFGYIGNGGDGDSTVVTDKDTRQEFKNVRSIDMDIWAGIVEIQTVEGTGQEVVVETKDIDKRLQLRYYMDGDELKFKTKEKLFRINNGSIGKIYIYIPKDYKFDEVSVDLGAGELNIDYISAREFGVDIGAGQAFIDSFTADELDLDCGAGSINARGAVNAEADIDCGVGEIIYTAIGKEADYNYKIDCGIGEVNCGGSSYSGIASEKEINNGAGKEMSIDCGIGSVTVDFEEHM